MGSSRFLNPTTPGGLLTVIIGILNANETLVIQSITTGQYFHINEVPTGLINSSNSSFTISAAPNPASSLEVYLNGQKLTLTSDYSVSGTTLLMVIPPQTGSILTVNYIVSPV